MTREGKEIYVCNNNNPPPPGRSDPLNMNSRKNRPTDITTPQIETKLTAEDGTKQEVISTARTGTGRAAEQIVM